ncbi:MAG: TonB-dependent receptor [Pseudomonadota bacterium]
MIKPSAQERSESHFSPKAALAFQVNSDWVVKASAGRAVRMPTVGELYQVDQRRYDHQHQCGPVARKILDR